MRREAPQNIFFAPHLAEVQPVRIDVLNLAERSAADDFSQFQERRVVLQEVADHQDKALVLG